MLDQPTLRELTKALDISMVRVLNSKLENIVAGNEPEGVATNLVGALKGLDGLRKGLVPNYEEKWLALPYLAWYGPSHVNMAFTLITEVIPQWNDCLKQGPFGVHLEDYACGIFAGQFALVLAASRSIGSFTSRKLSIFSDDSSDPMWNMGLDLWKDFRHEIGAVLANGKEYPHLDSIRNSARLLETRQPRNLPANVWLTVLHAAYGGDYGEILASKITSLIERKNPSLILTTAHKGSSTNMYLPPTDQYAPVVEKDVGPPMSFSGQFTQTSIWRKELFDKYVQPMEHRLSDLQIRMARRLLTVHPTTWNPGNFNYVYTLYQRR